jgi:erythromycin esterase
VATQRTLPPQALGRTVRLTGWIRTEGVDAGYAGVWMRIDGPIGFLEFDNMNERGPRGTTPWTRYVITLAVDSAATGIAFGVLHPGTGIAWFDSLTLEVLGPVRPRSVVIAPPRPPEDMSRLLSDAELAVVDTVAPPEVDSAAAAWVRANARPIRSLGARDFSDLGFLRALLVGKRIVQLGESSHGVREFNLAKVRLIQYLHEELGYDLLAFESSLFACDRAGREAATLTAEQLMRGCIFGVWHTDEVLALFEYVRGTQRTPRPLVLSGFDVQMSGAADSARSSFLKTVVGALDTTYASRVYAMDRALHAKMRSADAAAYAKRERDRLGAFYESLVTWIEARMKPLATAFANDPAAPALARQTARSISANVQQSAAGIGQSRTEIRDRGMADNLDFLLDVLHPGKKVIVWAHNSHIQHRGFGGVSASSAVQGRPRTMGTWIAERRWPELYTIGLYMYRGTAAHNNRRIYRVTPAAPASLEAILRRAPWKYAFVDLSRSGHEPGTAWMRQPVVAKEWGIYPQSIVPRDEYDGLLFIDTTWPPNYLRRTP